jgi:hypothetical protein
MVSSAGPSGLKIDRDDRDHALTGVAIECRPFGPELKAAMALWISPHSQLIILVLP